MGKAARFTRNLVRKEFLVAFGGTFFAILGLVATVLAILDWRLALLQSIAVASLGLVAAVWINWKKLLPPQVAIDDALPHLDQVSSPRRFRCPTDIRLAKQAAKLAEKCFAGSVTISPNSYEQLRVKNTYILACLTDEHGQLLGYFDAIPLRESFAIPFLRGSVTEDQITHEDVLAPNEMGSCKYLFVSGIAVDNPDTQRGKWNASIAVWGLLKYLAAFYRGANPLVFAVAATPAGDHLLKKFGLSLEADGSTRRDRYRLYSLPLTSREISNRLACLPDWSNLCVADWDARSPSKTSAGAARPALPSANVLSLKSKTPEGRARSSSRS